MTASAAPDLDNCCPAPPPGTPRLTVAQLARAAASTPDTVRYYERIGLLLPPDRTAADHRRYDDTAVDRLQFIRGAQRLGLTLREIKTLLEVRDTGVCPCEPAEGLLRQHVQEIDEDVSRLTALRAELVQMADAIPSLDCPDPAPGTWRPTTTPPRR